MIKRRILTPWLPTLLLFLLGICILIFPSIRFSAYVIFCAAFVALCYQLLRLLKKRNPRISKSLHRILTICLCILILAAVITEGFILHTSRGSKDIHCDYLIVLGAGVNSTVPSLSLQERLNAAYDYLIRFPDAICVVSGGQGPGEDITEAECMYRALTTRGIDKSRILLEDKATSTQENLAFSREVIARHAGTAPETVAIISSEYHLFRAGLMAKDQGLAPVLVPARTQWFSLRINYYVREIAAVWYYLVFGG